MLMAASIWNSVAPESMFPLTMYAIDWENQSASGARVKFECGTEIGT